MVKIQHSGRRDNINRYILVLLTEQSRIEATHSHKNLSSLLLLLAQKMITEVSWMFSLYKFYLWDETVTIYNKLSYFFGTKYELKYLSVEVKKTELKHEPPARLFHNLFRRIVEMRLLPLSTSGFAWVHVDIIEKANFIFRPLCIIITFIRHSICIFISDPKSPQLNLRRRNIPQQTQHNRPRSGGQQQDTVNTSQCLHQTDRMLMLGIFLETAWLEPSLWATWQQQPCHHWARTTLRTTVDKWGQVWCVLRPRRCPHVDWDWASGLVASWSSEASSLTIRISTLHIITIPHHTTPHTYLHLYLYPYI